MIVEIENVGKIKIRVIKNKDIYEYYIKDVKIGVYNPKVMEDNILILQNTLENELSSQIKDKVQNIAREAILEEAKQNEKIEKYAEKLGIERISDIAIVDLEQDKTDIEKEKSKKQDEHQEINEGKQNSTIKTINIKQEINLSERANDMQDLKKWLGGKIPSEFTKMAVIESTQMSKMQDEKGDNYKNNSTRYSLALIDKNGNIEPLQKYVPNLRQREASGNNPMAQKYQVDSSGKVEKDAVLSEYEIGSKVIQIDNKEMGTVEVNVGQEEHSGNETIGVQMRDGNTTFTTSTENRRVIGEYEPNGVRTVDENLNEAKQYENLNGNSEGMTHENIDGDKKTPSEVDLEKINIDYSELAKEWGLFKEGREPDTEKAKEVLKEEYEKNPRKGIQQIINEITDDANEEISGGIKR